MTALFVVVVVFPAMLCRADVPDVCAAVSDESPIDIEQDILQDGDDVCRPELEWAIEEDHEDFLVEYNCYDFKVIPADGDAALDSEANTISRIQTEGTPFDDYDEYCLAQFHFHWGSGRFVGSEHTVDGRRFEMEAHFVHYACEFGNFSAAQEFGGRTDTDEHTLLVVGLFFEQSEDDNPAFDALLSDDVLDEMNGNCGEEYEVSSDDNVLDELLPEDYLSQGYYAYQGSLTTPPCSDDVNWIVLKARSYISESQLERFRSLINTTSGDPIMRNWRDIQENNPNPVYECCEDDDDDSDDDSDSDSDSSDSSDDDNAFMARALESEKDTMGAAMLDTDNGADEHVNDVMVSLSKGTFENLWALCALVLVVNVALCVGWRCRNKGAKQHIDNL